MGKLKKLEKMILSERHLTFVPEGNENNEVLAATAIKNLEDLGYTLDNAGYEKLKTASKDDITQWYVDISRNLVEMSGGDHDYRPFYPNFPEEVMEMSDFDLFINQILHYAAGYRPQEENQKEGIKSLEEHDLQVISSAKGNGESAVRDAAREIFQNCLKTKGNLPNGMLGSIGTYMDEVPTWTDDAHTVTNRQLLCSLYLIAVTEKKNTEALPELVTNDYLKIAAISHTDGESHEQKLLNFIHELDSTEGGINNIRSVPRSLRKFIVNGLNQQSNLEEDVARHKSQFKVLFKLIHVNEYDHITSDHFKEVVKKLRNNERLETYYSKVERAFKENDMSKAIKLLSSRPGEFVKSINRLLTMDFTGQENAASLYDDFIKACQKALPKTRPEDLCKLVQYMNSRTREYKMNVHNIKGVKIIDEDHVLKPINRYTADKVINSAKEAIAEQLASQKDYGKVYIEEGMEKMAVPSRIKDTSETSNSYTPGSRIQLERDEKGEPKNIRFSVWWTNTESNSRVDLDLSTKFYGLQDAKESTEISMGAVQQHTVFVEETGEVPKTLVSSGGLSYASGLKKTGCVHSGDITNGGSYNGKGATEYVDININALKNNGVKFVKFYVNSYTGQPFNTLGHCEFAIQERNELTMSNQFDIRAVKQHGKLTTAACGTIPCILDVEKGELIWTDSAEYMVKAGTNVYSKAASNGFNILMDELYYGDQMSMAELARIAVEANHGVLVNDPKEADTLFMVDNYDEKTEGQRVITSKDTDIWLGEFLSPQESQPEAPERDIIEDHTKTPASTLEDIIMQHEQELMGQNSGNGYASQKDAVIPGSSPDDEYEEEEPEEMPAADDEEFEL